MSKSDDGSQVPQIKWGITHEKDLNMMVVYRGLNNADCSSSLTTHTLQLHQMACFCANVAVFQLLRPSVLTGWNENIHVKDTFEGVDFLEDFHGKPRLKRSHKYYTQMQVQTWVCGVCHGFFIALVGHKAAPLCMSELNITWNFVLML